MVVFKRGVSLVLGTVAVALVFSVAWTTPAFGEGPATYEMSFGSAGSGNGQFSHPAGIATDPEGSLWVVDQGHNRVEKFNEGGEYLSQFGSSGSENGEFNRPTSIAIDPSGNLWVTDANNDRVEKFNEEGEFLKAVGSAGSGSGHFSGPEGIAADAEGHIWVADTYNGRVQEFNEAGEFIQVIGSYGSGEGQLGEPTDIDIGAGGDIWIADWQNNRVSVFDSEGEFVRQFGSSGSGAGKFNRPDEIDVDSKGNVWVGDEGNERVEQFDESGEYLGQFGSGGSGEGEFGFAYPFGIATDSGTHIWIADPTNNRVQRWTTAAVPVCHSGEASTEVNEALILGSGALECEGEEPLEYEIVSGPKHGEITGFNTATGALTYIPDSEFAGSDSFTFAASNSLGKSATKSFSIQVGAAPLGEGIVAAYPFNEDEGETAHDAANGHDGEIFGPNWVQGKYGSALNFVAEDPDLVVVPSDSAFELTEALTVEAWVRPRILSDYAPVVTKARGPYDQSYQLNAGGQDWGVPGAFIVHENHMPLWASGSEELPPETWTHLAMTYNGELMKLYVDGKLTDTQTSGTPHTGEGSLNIGIGSNSGSAFDGKIDEVRVYDRSLSGTEIEKDMATPIEGSEGSEDPEEPEEPEACEAPQVEVSGEASEPEVPGVNLSVEISPGNPPCADNGEQSRPAKIEVLIDEEPVYSETRTCERPPDPCSRVLRRRIQLPYAKLIGTHSVRVDVEDQLGNKSEPVELTETTPPEGTISSIPPEAEDSKGSKGCETPKDRASKYVVRHGVIYGTDCADIIPIQKKGVTTYYGFEGDDRIRGGGGTDKIRGGSGDDTIFGGRGSDKVFGEGGDDRLERLVRATITSGEEEATTALIGGPGGDVVLGEDGDDLVRGGTTHDKLFGGSGTNTLSYADGVTPGFETDPETGSSNPETDLVKGFPAEHGERGVYVNLSGSPATIANDGAVARYGGGSDKIVEPKEFQNVIGTAFADLIVGSSEANVIDAGPGTDIVRGGGGRRSDLRRRRQRLPRRWQRTGCGHRAWRSRHRHLSERRR